MPSPPGQITPDSPFGRALIALLQERRDIKVVVDEGSWHANGTTLCIVHALAGRSGVQVIAVEANKQMYESGVKFWTPCPPSLSLKWGRINEKMMTEEAVRSHRYFKRIEQHFNLHWYNDLECLAEAPFVELPRFVDMFVLDGSEFSGEASLARAIQHRPKFLALDDIETMKHCDTVQYLIRTGEWVPIASGSDRTGWVILERKSSAATDFLSRYIEPGFGC